MSKNSILVVTQGRVYLGADPRLLPESEDKLRRMTFPQSIPLIVCGTGTCFVQISRRIEDVSDVLKVKYSPLCGTADRIGSGKIAFLTSGIQARKDDQYIGLADISFDAWAFLSRFEPDTLFVVGRDFWNALALKDAWISSCLFRLVPEDKTCTCLQ